MTRLALRLLAAAAAALGLPRCRGLAFAPHSALGPVMVGRGREVREADAYAVNAVASVCDCRMACWSDRRCVAASALAAKDKSVLCRLSSKGPFDSTLDDSPNATYIFWNEHAIIMDDGLVYTEATRIGSFVEMENLCNGVPGHRLPIFKTFVQKNVMDQLFNRDTSRAFWVDLRKISLTDYVWGDGTPLRDTEISALLRIARGAATEAVHSVYFSSILEKSITFQERVVCQANPFGVEW
ncbi:uncharacterized protein LOC119572988 isoform X2 [Penaeus monodon]|uniref:uncharacterized protein LOC119572988 isoform X2 n=1 Tax=Penaeus monodon TaxID=6687 RepID=UPI0018A6DA07|nr:uncharacterized protein LOC119572988 isoform X2 [Penaeus monodon]